MTLKFDLHECENRYSLKIKTEETIIRVDGTEAEFRRLLIDLIHEFREVEK